MARKIGIVGYGHLGQYLVTEIQKRKDLELAFVWNRTQQALKGIVSDDLILDDLDSFKDRDVDLIVEVAHPSITQKYGTSFLEQADYMVGSPTALADADLEKNLRLAATSHGLYIPSGAFWGGEDIQKMADRGTLQALKITMRKHPSSYKLSGELEVINSSVTDESVVLYEGPKINLLIILAPMPVEGICNVSVPGVDEDISLIASAICEGIMQGSVRALCPLAPNNVNTMAAGAIAAHNLGFDKVQGVLVSDPSSTDWHVVEVELWGPGDITADKAFHCKTVKRNPATLGAVTGSATYASFLSSVIGAHGKGTGIHLC